MFCGGTLSVYVTDPTAYTWAPDVESRAFAAARTVYLPSGTISMLPRNLTEGELSLTEGKTHPCFAIHLDYDGAANLVQTRVERAKVDILRNLTYTEAATLEPFAGITDFARLLLAKRTENDIFFGRFLQRLTATNGAGHERLNGWGVNEDGKPIRLKPYQANAGHLIVQEAMIAANAALATWCRERDLPVLFRVHERTSDVSLESSGEGESLPQKEERGLRRVLGALLTPDDFERVTAKIPDWFGRAKYQPEPGRHLGLGLPQYVHATSPVRRYADLITLRQVGAVLDGRRPPYNARSLSQIARWLGVVADEDKEQIHQHFKEKAVVKAEKRLDEETPETLASLPEADFTRLLKVAHQTQDTRHVQPLQEAVILRAGCGKLSDAQTVLALMSLTADEETTYEKADMINAIVRSWEPSPQRALQVLYQSVTQGLCSGLEITFEQKPGQTEPSVKASHTGSLCFRATVTLTRNETGATASAVLQGVSHWQRSKREAQQQAALHLIESL